MGKTGPAVYFSIIHGINVCFSDGLPPYAEVSLPLLVSQQAYGIALHLSIPATESNFALGNFMTTLTLSTTSNKTLTSIRRPVSIILSIITATQ